jgi:hypothetical protein
MRSNGSPSCLRRVLAHVPVRMAGAAVAAVTLAASLLATAPPAGAAVRDTACPVVWNGTDLVTAALSPGYELYAYEQRPGASSWTKQLVAAISPEGEPFVTISMAATSDSVQIVAEDATGSIYFFQQTDGESAWPTGQLVGSVSTFGYAEGLQTPQIAWTGVPGHTGTNSVITVADSSGNILMWYQNGGGWSQETAWGHPSGGYEYYDATPTATDKGIVIVALDSNGSVDAFSQAYGPNPWVFDDGIGAPPGQSFDSVAVTWDGVNVDVAATFNAGSGSSSPDTLMFLWKSDSATAWNSEAVLGPNPSEPFDDAPSITWTGDNLLLTAVQQLSSTQERLDSWWQGSTFTNFNFESGPDANSPHGYGPPQMTYTEGAASPETAITVPVSANDFETTGLNDWTIPLGSSVWTRHMVAPA